MAENAPLKQESDFTFDGGYDAEAALSERFAHAERLVLDAICAAPDFTDLFDDAECMAKVYDDTKGTDAGVYYLFRAHDAATGRRIAVKTTNPALCHETPQLEECIRWESRILERLKSKKRMQQILTPLRTMHIALKSGNETFHEQISFFSSIYLGVDVRKSFFDASGASLKTFANRLNLFCSIVTAVQALHREGFCHRDLKPSNVMGTRDKSSGKCTAVLIDFGLSLARPQIEKELRMFSPQAEFPDTYAAPELYSCFEDNWDLAQSADIYSLGCMLFELLDKRLFRTALLEANDRVTYWGAVNNIRVGKEEYGGDAVKRLRRYDDLLAEFAPNILIPRLQEDSVLPEYVRKELQKIIEKMCAFDYRRRAKESELDGIKGKIRLLARIADDAHLRELYKKKKAWQRTNKEKGYA
ncbi:MAG: protein kinase [Treponema sp.]|nr:protein kinase [Treponema sp.]